VVGVDVPEDTPIGRLQEVLDEFLRTHPSREAQGKIDLS